MNVNIELDRNFVIAYNRLLAEYGEELAALNGFAAKQLSYTDFIDNFVDHDTVADASIDGNANVGHKDIVTLMNEMPKPHQKLLAYNKIFHELAKKYGLGVANEWLRLEWEGHLYMHDANTSTFVSYCFAYDLKDLAEKGLFFIENFNAEPPKHLVTFVDFVKEFVSYNSNRTSGACGLPNLIPYMYYFWSRDVANGYFTPSPEGYARQNIQRLIYALNQPYTRNGIQSAFTNTSQFDKPYLEALFGGSTFPDGAFMIDELDGIMDFQKMFLETMSEIRAKNMMTFPVNSISLLRKNGKFEDEEFARWAVAHNMKWNDSNLFIDDSVTSLSNCCRLKSNIADLG
jgi:ribonucleoside-triphosphate reductase